MINPVKVSEGVYRGAQPVTREDWQMLVDLGIKHTLDLETGAHWLSDGQPLYEALCGDNMGIRVWSHPLGEILPPTQYELNGAWATMLLKHSIYVHCKAGVDRTGMVCAYYRMQSQDWTRSKAIAEMKELGMHVWYYWWAWFL